MKSFLRLFAPPVFDDDYRTIAARLLYILLLTIIAASVVYSVAFAVFFHPPQQDLYTLSPAIGSILIAVGLLALTRRGFVRMASVLLIALLWCLLTASMVARGGIQAYGMGGYMLLTFMTGLLLGGRAGVVVASVCISTSLVILIMQSTGLLPPLLPPLSPILIWSIYIGFFLLAIVLQYGAGAGQTFYGALLKTSVTQRIHAEQTLKTYQERLQLVVSEAPIILFAMDRDGIFILSEGKGLTTLGLQPNQVVGHSVYDVYSDLPELRDLLASVLEGETVSTVIAARGVAFETTYAPLRDHADNIIGIVGVATDVTERKQAELLRGELERERELREAKSRFISMVIHDFRNPLSSIYLSLTMLKAYIDRMDSQERVDRLDGAMAQIEQLNKLVDEVLAVSKDETLPTRFFPVRQDLCAFSRTILVEFSQASSNGHQFLFYCDSSAIMVDFDDELMRRVIANLLNNAIKYSPAGGTIQLRLASAEDKVVLQISDEGIGIPEQERQNLFDPFHRASNVGAIKGTGLGLAIVRHIIDLHNGTIAVASQVNQGTTFTIELPIRQALTAPAR